jgi:hypothetical protein
MFSMKLDKKPDMPIDGIPLTRNWFGDSGLKKPYIESHTNLKLSVFKDYAADSTLHPELSTSLPRDGIESHSRETRSGTPPEDGLRRRRNSWFIFAKYLPLSSETD